MASRYLSPRPTPLKVPFSLTGRVRNTIQRRYAGTQESKLVGPMDNAFNRERLAVKEHAGKSAGTWDPLTHPSIRAFR